MKKLKIKGEKFGNLTIVDREPSNKHGNSMWLCQCACGNRVVVRGGHLTSGAQVSCGCLRNSRNKTRFVTHGMSKSKFYGVWRTMKSRCNNPNSRDYFIYGGKGVKCLWKNFGQFQKDMYDEYLSHIEKFGEKNTSIDRIDPEGDYCKDNCRWTTWSVQANNKRVHKHSFI